jgi:8-oxo-dGTP pyrophosphatase MutT (NUDIX family)
MKVKKHHSAGVVVFKEIPNGKRKYLILHYPSGHWDYAKGHLEEGETSKEAAIRELEEETAINDVHIYDGLLVPMYYEYTGHGFLHKKTVDYYAGETKFEENQVKISHEHQGFGWYTYREALDRLTFDNAKDILTAVEAFMRTKKHR